jgi:hypothetical protein
VPRAEETPLDTAHFSVLIDGVDTSFSYVGGIGSESDPEDPRSSTPATVLLRRAVTGSRDLFLWRQAVAEGKEDTRRVVVRQHTASGRTVNAWVLEGAWPRRWSGPTFDAVQGGVAMEEVELAYDRVIWPDDPDDIGEESHGGGA